MSLFDFDFYESNAFETFFNVFLTYYEKIDIPPLTIEKLRLPNFYIILFFNIFYPIFYDTLSSYICFSFFWTSMKLLYKIKKLNPFSIIKLQKFSVYFVPFSNVWLGSLLKWLKHFLEYSKQYN